MTKVCTKCGAEKDVSEFSVRRASPDGLAYVCRVCKNAQDKVYRESPEGRAKIKEHLQKSEVKAHRNVLKKIDYKKHKPKRRATADIWYENNKEKALADIKRWQQDNPERTRATKKRSADKFKKENPELAKKKAVESMAKQLQRPTVRLAFNLRSRLRKAVKKRSKGGSAVRDLGCSVEELRTHLSTKWTDGMSWENYGCGIGKWSIDHIVPLVLFDLTNRQHVVLACHYLNLQPMWFEENSSKGAKFDGF